MKFYEASRDSWLLAMFILAPFDNAQMLVFGPAFTASFCVLGIKLFE
jgi:hypothetical protein